MTIIETMGRAICATGNVPGFKCTCPLFGEPAGNDWCNGNRAPAQARAALRSVKPEDISARMSNAFNDAYNEAVRIGKGVDPITAGLAAAIQAGGTE